MSEKLTLKAVEQAIQAFPPSDQRKLLADLPALLMLSKEDVARLKLAEPAFGFWDNPEDSVYDSL